MEGLLERLARGDVLLADGATGTMLMERGLEPGACPEALNLERPALLEEVASLYLEAGSDLLGTNTFGGSPAKLATYSLEDQTEEINRRGVEAVRKVVGDRALVAASMGPSGRLLEPYGDTKPEVLQQSFERQARALIGAGADLVLVETMTDLNEAVLAVRGARSVSKSIPVVAGMTFDPTPRGYFTVYGVTVEQAAKGLEQAGADVVGSNCGHGIEDMVAIAREYKRLSRLPLAIQSNAGLPHHEGGRIVFPEGPELMAAKARELVELGVGIIGGCCGTTPEHIRALRRLLDEWVSRP